MIIEYKSKENMSREIENEFHIVFFIIFKISYIGFKNNKR